MRRLACSVVLVALATPAHAWFESSEVGTRAFGLGNAFVSVADDPSAVFWNPAGLVQLRRNDALVAFDHYEELHELQSGFAAAAVHVAPCVVGAGWQHTGLDAAASEDLWSLSVAATPVRKSLGAFVACGATLEVARVGIEAGNAPVAVAPSHTGVAAHFGLLLAPIPNIVLGAVLRHVGEPRFDLIAGGEATTLEREFEWGASLRFRRDAWLHVSRVRHSGGTTATRAGAELHFAERFGISAGVGPNAISGGLDMRVGPITIETAYRAIDALGASYRAGLRFAFGPERAGTGGQYDDF